MRECYPVMLLGLGVSMCSGVRSKSMAQGQDKLNLLQATAREQADADKRKRVFAIVMDARQDSRIWVNEVARVTLQCGERGSSGCVQGCILWSLVFVFCELWFFRPLHNRIATPPLTEVKG